MVINEFAKKAYAFYTASGMTPAGACGLMGNQFAESAGFIANRVEFLLIQRFREDGFAITDEYYTAAVDNRSISRAAFLSPRGKHYGYGLCQWTTDSRKAGLYDLAAQRGVSIADEQLQLDYTLQELKTKYQYVWKLLCSATDVNTASDYVLAHFEQPNNWQLMSEKRAAYGRVYFAELAWKESNNMIIVGSARIDENGNISGGAAGDQTGNEVSTQAFYMHSKGWYCLRPKNAAHAAKMAVSMANACANNNIGYDQNNRNAVSMVRKYGSTAVIAERTETDCGNLVRACILEATGVDVGEFYTGNEAGALENSGLFQGRFTVANSSEVYDGDVLVTKSTGHTVIVVSGRPRSSSAPITIPVNDNVDIKATYRVKTQRDGWLAPVTEQSDYAGWKESPIIAIAIKASVGSIKYRVHETGKPADQWCNWITGYDINDFVHGYAGNNTPIDAVEVFYKTPAGMHYRKAKYRVAPIGKGYFGWQHDDEKTNGQDGYAGEYGKTIGKFQMCID